MADDTNAVQGTATDATPAVETDKQNLPKAVANVQQKLASQERLIEELAAKLAAVTATPPPVDPLGNVAQGSAEVDLLAAMPQVASRVIEQDKKIAKLQAENEAMARQIMEVSKPVGEAAFERAFKQKFAETNPTMAPKAKEMFDEFVRQRDSMLDPNETVPTRTQALITERAYERALAKVSAAKQDSTPSTSASRAAARTDSGNVGDNGFDLADAIRKMPLT